MNTRLLICCCILLAGLPLLVPAQNVCSGLDGVDIYRNSKRVATWTASEVITVEPNTKGIDTITFHAWTAMESLKNATIDIKDNSDQVVAHLYGQNNTGYETDFTYVFNAGSFTDPKITHLQVLVNLVCEKDKHPEQVAAIVINHNK